jgi:hypothetical protein
LHTYVTMVEVRADGRIPTVFHGRVREREEEFVVEKPVGRNGPLGCKGGTIREGGRVLRETVPA